MSEATVLFAKALDFAARKHVHRRRDTVLVLSGLLHGAIEDTDTNFEELAAEFGREVAHVVAEVSDDKSLRKAERKRRHCQTNAS